MIYSLLPAAAKAADEIGTTPEDGRSFLFPRIDGQTLKDVELSRLQYPVAEQTAKPLSVLRHLPGHNRMARFKKTERQSSASEVVEEVGHGVR